MDRDERPVRDDAVDRLLASLAQHLETGDASRGELDEIAIQRLRKGDLSDEERDALLARLADDVDARQAWAESAKPMVDGDLTDRVTRAVLDQREAEGLPVVEPRPRRTVYLTWAAVAAGVLIGLLVLPRLFDRTGPLPPVYDAEFSGYMLDVRGDDDPPPDVPTYAATSRLEISLRPASPAESEVALTAWGIDPSGDVVALPGLTTDERNGVFVVRGQAVEVLGQAAGTWRLVFVLSPEPPGPALSWVTNQFSADDPDGVSELPGSQRAVIRTVIYQP